MVPKLLRLYSLLLTTEADMDSDQHSLVSFERAWAYFVQRTVIWICRDVVVTHKYILIGSEQEIPLNFWWLSKIFLVTLYERKHILSSLHLLSLLPWC